MSGKCIGTEASMTTNRAWNKVDRREVPRGRLELKLALIYPERGGRPSRPMFNGKTCDISMSGVSIVVDYNIFQEGEVALALALPRRHAGAARKVVTATAEMTYAIYSSKLQAYKIGLAFRKFRGSGRALLEAALRHALKEADEPACETPTDADRAR
jgi:hypothetical protein